MEREELRNKVNENLESSQTTLSSSLSEETINSELDDALEDVTDDGQVDDKFVAKIAKRLQRIDGNLHKNVSAEVKKYKETVSAKGKAGVEVHKTAQSAEPEEPEWFKTYREAQEAKWNKLDADKKASDAAAVKKATLEGIEKGLKAKFKDAGIEANDYILKQTLRDIVIPDASEDGRIDEGGLTDKAEKTYFKNLKEAGLEKKSTLPHFGTQIKKGGNGPVDSYFARKAQKEGWSKAKSN